MNNSFLDDMTIQHVDEDMISAPSEDGLPARVDANKVRAR